MSNRPNFTGSVTVKCNKCDFKNCLLPMSFTGSFNNNNYFSPGNRASWARRMRPNGGNGRPSNAPAFNNGQRLGNRIGVNRLGGPVKGFL